MIYTLLADVPAETMTPMAWLVFAMVAGFVWGGFALLLLRAVRREGKKR